MAHELTEAGAGLAQALIRDPVVARSIAQWSPERIALTVEPHGLGAEEALVLLAVAAMPGRN